MTQQTAIDLNNQGGALYNKGDFLGAKFYYQAALLLDRDFLPSLANMAVVLSHENNLCAAIACLRRVTALAPLDGNQWNNLGNVLMRDFKYADAEIAFSNAIELCPDNIGTWHNLALLMSRIGEYDKALEYIERAKALGANGNGLENDHALTLMHKGDDLAQALAVYEARWETIPHSQAWDFHIPEWQGESLINKHILFHAEQGYGDTLMTARFVKDLQSLGARVSIGVLPGMVRLFQQQNWNIGVVDLTKMSPEDARFLDYQTPMFSAMRWLGIERKDIRGRAYLKAPEIVTPALPQDKFNIGICWASGKRGGDADWRRRIAPLENWLQLANHPRVALHSLQAGPDALDIGRLSAEVLISDCMSSFDDWADTAAFVSKLDLVISVDTAVAHLAAVLGKPTWMLSQFMHCWRWWNLAQGSGAPWYDSMRILQQSDPQDWNLLLNTCCEWLKFEV